MVRGANRVAPRTEQRRTPLDLDPGVRKKGSCPTWQGKCLLGNILQLHTWHSIERARHLRAEPTLEALWRRGLSNLALQPNASHLPRKAHARRSPAALFFSSHHTRSLGQARSTSDSREHEDNGEHEDDDLQALGQPLPLILARPHLGVYAE